MSNINTPLFKVGELVGLASINFPHLNGQYLVDKVFYKGDTDKCRITGKPTKYGGVFSEIGYIFTQPLMDKGDEREIIWAEKALRKLHKTSDYSFQQLLTELKNTDKIPSTT